MQTRIYYYLFIYLIITCCQNREWTNPFDPNCPKEIWTPTNFKAVQEGTTVKLTWNQPIPQISGFRIQKTVAGESQTSIPDISKGDNQYIDNNLIGGKSHSYSLTAYAGANLSNTVTASVTPILTAGITTAAVTAIDTSSMISGGTINTDGGAPITARGVCWSKNLNPTIVDSKTINGTGTGSFTSTISGLTHGTTYYIRAYSTNSAGTSYGNQVMITTAVFVPSMTTYFGTGLNPFAIAFDGTNMWTANFGNNSVTKISPEGIMKTYSGTGPFPDGIAFDGTNMWTSNGNAFSVTKITPTGEITIYEGTGPNPLGIAFDGTNMWTANELGTSVTKISPTGAMVTYMIGANPSFVAFDGTDIWITALENSGNNVVIKITSAGLITTYSGVGSQPMYIAFDGTNMWTVNNGDNSVSKISPSGVVTTYMGKGAGPGNIAFDGTNMWTANQEDNSVTRISPLGVMTTFSGTGSRPTGIAFDGINMWTTNLGDNSVTKIKVR